jgi:hypothetical protein
MVASTDHPLQETPGLHGLAQPDGRHGRGLLSSVFGRVWEVE